MELEVGTCEAANLLDLTRGAVVHLHLTGRLPARRVKAGRRQFRRFALVDVLSLKAQREGKPRVGRPRAAESLTRKLLKGVNAS